MRDFQDNLRLRNGQVLNSNEFLERHLADNGNAEHDLYARGIR